MVNQLWALFKLWETSQLIFCHILKVTFFVTHIWNNLGKPFHMSNFISFNFLLVQNWCSRYFVFQSSFLWEPKAWWCVILPEGFMAGFHKVNIFPPLFYITLTNRNAEPFNYRACLTHPESQIFWWCLAEGEKCTEFPELLVKTMTPRKVVNNLAGPTVDVTMCPNGPHGSVSVPVALQHCIPWWWYFVWASGWAAKWWA